MEAYPQSDLAYDVFTGELRKYLTEDKTEHMLAFLDRYDGPRNLMPLILYQMLKVIDEETFKFFVCSYLSAHEVQLMVTGTEVYSEHRELIESVAMEHKLR